MTLTSRSRGGRPRAPGGREGSTRAGGGGRAEPTGSSVRARNAHPLAGDVQPGGVPLEGEHGRLGASSTARRARPPTRSCSRARPRRLPRLLEHRLGRGGLLSRADVDQARGRRLREPRGVLPQAGELRARLRRGEFRARPLEARLPLLEQLRALLPERPPARRRAAPPRAGPLALARPPRARGAAASPAPPRLRSPPARGAATPRRGCLAPATGLPPGSRARARPRGRGSVRRGPGGAGSSGRRSPRRTPWRRRARLARDRRERLDRREVRRDDRRPPFAR